MGEGYAKIEYEHEFFVTKNMEDLINEKYKKNFL